ncbi:MAG: hypothetical protein ABIN91_19715 [Mucilaginibacter sp.]|uniref:hypothetical protein n=1 Tax=Mucilaginibacter sp. TaxID=1882438 RepID=UPI003266F5CC
MTTYKEHDSVVYTDAAGNQIDTFVIYGTDVKTGLTHINHMDLLVPLKDLQIHPKTLKGSHIPMSDTFSFEILKKLKAKYTDHDTEIKTKTMAQPAMRAVYSQAS